MHRLRIVFAFAVVLVALHAAPALARQEMTGDNAPAVVLEDESAAPEEAAWTFRYLVPSLIGATGIAIFVVVLGYGVRVRGRYRVTQ